MVMKKDIIFLYFGMVIAIKDSQVIGTEYI
jgi:hypothetical protein